MTNRLKHTIFIAIICSLIIPYAVIIVYSAFLKGVLEERIKETIQDALKADYVSLHLGHLGPFGIELRALKVESKDGPFIEANAVEIKYSPQGLMHGWIDSVEVSGLRLSLERLKQFFRGNSLGTGIVKGEGIDNAKGFEGLTVFPKKIHVSGIFFKDLTDRFKSAPYLFELSSNFEKNHLREKGHKNGFWVTSRLRLLSRGVALRGRARSRLIFGDKGIQLYSRLSATVTGLSAAPSTGIPEGLVVKGDGKYRSGKGLGGNFTLSFFGNGYSADQDRLKVAFTMDPGLGSASISFNSEGIGLDYDGTKKPFTRDILGTIHFEEGTFGKKASQIEGKLKISSLDAGMLSTGPLVMRLHGNEKALDLEGSYTVNDVGPSPFSFKGRLDIEALQRRHCLDLPLSVQENSIDITDLGIFSPTLQGISLKGKTSLSLPGGGDIQEGPCTHLLHLGLQEGILEIPDLGRVQGIGTNLRIFLHDFPKTPPGQTLRFKRFDAGTIRLDDGLVRFVLDPKWGPLIQEAHATWADGTIFVYGLQIPRAKDESLKLTLFCDRINISEMLRELGVPRVKGEGQVSGRLPIWYKNGHLAIKHGILATIPGEGGDIRIPEASLVTGAIPAGTSLYSQLQFASEALKNFHYKWIKIYFEDEGKDGLLIKMMLDGRPSSPLPFRYDPRTGVFKRSRTSKIQQDMRIDVNFMIPLDKVLNLSRLKNVLETQ